MSSQPKSVVKVDATTGTVNKDFLKDWESRRSEEYKEYRKQWYENPVKHKLNNLPLHLDIEATSACNMLCTMCSRTEMINDGTFWKVEHFNMEKYKKIVDLGAKNGLKSIKFQFWGEPLLNKRLPEMIKYAKDAGIVDLMCNTNASLLDDKRSRELIKSGLTKLFFSFDSPYRDKYNEIRILSNGKKGEYDKVLNNIKNFMKIKKEMKSDTPLTRVQMVIMKENDGEFEDFKKLFSPIVDTVGYTYYLAHGDQDKSKEVFKKDGGQKPNFACPQIFQRMFVHPDGVVTPCCIDARRELKMGNINENSLTEIWKNEKYTKLRKQHIDGEYYKNKVCRDCALARAVE